MWSTIKTECVRRQHFNTRAEAEMALFQYIDGFYNTTRIQKGLGWRSPDEFEAAHHTGELTDQDYTRLAEAATRRRARRERHRKDKPTPATPATTPPAIADTHRGPGRSPGTIPGTRTGTANRVRPTRRTPTTPQKNRSTG
jgi:putative transposase